MRLAGFALWTSLCGAWLPAWAEPPANPPSLDTASVDAVAAEWLASSGAPSASIAIVQQGRLVYAQAYGAARLNPSVPAAPSTRYAIDSVSKEFTAAALLLLAEHLVFADAISGPSDQSA